MKKIILLSILLYNFSSLNAQNYAFNILTKYVTNFENKDRETICYSNSKNDSYFLRLSKNENSFVANLYDYKNLKVHAFKVLETKLKNEILFEFKYQNTTELDSFDKNKYSKYVYTFQTLKVIDSIKKVKFSVYENLKNKKPLMEYQLEIKNSNENLFPAFRLSCIHPYEFLEKLNTFENGIVINATGTTLSAKDIKFKLEDFKRINFELDIPKS